MTHILDQAPIVGRNQIGHFLNVRGLQGSGVEIGTHRGGFASTILDLWQGKMLHCVDPWEDSPEYKRTQTGTLAHSDGNRKRDFNHCLNLLNQKHPGRCMLHMRMSHEALPLFEDLSLDFVYIDGDHMSEAVYNDLVWWWPKIHKDGFIFGHDFICPGEVDGGWGKHIQPAVEKFCEELHIPRVYAIIESPIGPWSYMIPKTPVQSFRGF